MASRAARTPTLTAVSGFGDQVIVVGEVEQPICAP